jgi:hypothetical protein
LLRKKLAVLPFTLGLLILVLAWPEFASAKPKHPPTLHWARGAPGCAFRYSDDGYYFYTLTTVNYEIVLRVDSHELEKVHHRNEPFFSVLLSVHYRAGAALSVDPFKTTLEFVRHHDVQQTALDPDSLSLRAQQDVEQVEFETEREIKKHPESKEEHERFLQTYKKEVTDLQDFLSRQVLSQAQLTPANPEALGWILFSTRSKWIGSWKTPEGFVFHLPIDQLVVEFPFSLPEGQEDLELRRRPE